MKNRCHRGLIGACILLAFLITVFPALSKGKGEKELLRLIPQGRQLPGWQMSEKPRFFDAENLFEYINGAADLYILYGFRLVLTTDYRLEAESTSVTVEIYAMQSPLHAFGIYAAERSPNEETTTIGVEGYIGANVLNFYKGLYYVKITSFAIGQDLRERLQEMGAFIAANIKGEFKPPEVFQYFPRDDRVPHSERFIPSHFLGQSYLVNGYRCDYHDESCGSYQLFLVPFKDEMRAQEAFALYKKFLIEQNKPHRIDKDENYQRILQYSSEQNQFAFCYGRFLGGAMGVGCENAMKNKMEEMVQNLR